MILKSVKGPNSVGKFGKIICISSNMDHIYINAETNQNRFIISKLIWFDFCFTALQHILGHFGGGQLT